MLVNDELDVRNINTINQTQMMFMWEILKKHISIIILGHPLMDIEV
jgi:hypothetical protein